MITSATEIGANTGLVTNGSMLTENLLNQLVDCGLDWIWISADSAHRASYQSQYSTTYQEQLAWILKKIQEVRDQSVRMNNDGSSPNLGLALVITQKNLKEILDLIQMGQSLGVSSFFVTDLEAHTPIQVEEALSPSGFKSNQTPRKDIKDTLLELGPGIHLSGSLTDEIAHCPFALKGQLALRWDGEISPCLPLLYDHTTYYGSWQRQVFAFSLGNINRVSLNDVWQGAQYQELQTRLLNNDFSPCFSCRDCWFSEDNLQDCMGFGHPTCGGCAWSQGLIACP
jgi:MoaA/NifB/PqqE/SkfB family radical SAM enzyme